MRRLFRKRLRIRNGVGRYYWELCVACYEGRPESRLPHPVEERIAAWDTLEARHSKAAVHRHGERLTGILDAIQEDAWQEVWGWSPLGG